MSSNKRITLPRRTQEFEIPVPPSSVKKPQTRASRIAQPVRKSTKPGLGQFGENGRSRSMEKGLSGMSLGVPSTATKKSLNPRSSSVTPRLRTPLRSVGYAANAENVLQQTIPSTVERERSTVDAQKIFDYLAQANVPDLPKDFVDRRNLKAMSMKQFLIIVAHLFRQIGGSRYKIGSNFIEDILKAITELQCPFTVNKSMLKTPSAPHSIHQVITMLSWLIDLAPPPVSGTEWAPNYLHASEFPSQDYTHFFYQSAMEIFHLWNLKKEEEFGEQVDTMVDRLVACKTNGLDQKQVRERTVQLQKQLESVNANRPEGQTREQSFDGVQREVLEKQREAKQLATETKQLAKELERQEQEHYKRQDQYYDYEKSIRVLKEELARQEMTVAERDEMRNLITRDKNIVAAKRNAIASLEEASSDHQITLSRLTKQKINFISELNTKLCNLSNALQPDILFTPIELSLTAENYPALEKSLLELEHQMNDIFKQYHERYAKLAQEKCRLEQRLSDIQLTLQPLEAKIASQTARLERLQQQRDTITRQLTDLAVRANEQENWEDRAKQLDQEAEKIKQQLESNKKAIEKLAQNKQQLMEEGLEQCRVALAQRQQKLAEFTTYVEGCEAIMEKICDACSPDETSSGEAMNES
ncbi:AGAP006661-PA-like protein [Anopheles sinensis]|uniref:Kinetochore protein NDC80 n=1 Tax=Anopheles sinensis TaxID=74873 RepID=A0A084WK03_ANOSI|nr:AGAP006661-PA-like protein [Anopheles sinensis]